MRQKVRNKETIILATCMADIHSDNQHSKVQILNTHQIVTHTHTQQEKNYKIKHKIITINIEYTKNPRFELLRTCLQTQQYHLCWDLYSTDSRQCQIQRPVHFAAPICDHNEEWSAVDVQC